MEHELPTPDQIERHLAGGSDAREAALVHAYLIAHPGVAGYYAALRDELRGLGESGLADASRPRAEASFAILRERLEGEVPILSDAPRAGKEGWRLFPRLHERPFVVRLGTHSLRRHAMAAFAVVALAAVGFFTVSRYRPTHAPSPMLQTYATVAGQRATVTLPNGTHVVLGPATTLAVRTNTANAGITVQLAGQALFTVPHDAKIPFVVHTANTTTRVLGTSFVIRRYSTDTATRVVVTEGRVALSIVLRGNGGARDSVPAKTETILTARTLGIVDDSGRMSVTRHITTDDYTAWTVGRLEFRQTPVREIIADLGRAYGADIRLSDSTFDQRAFTWTVPVTRQSLAGVLEALTALLDAHVVRSGNVIMIAPGPSAPRKSRNQDIPSHTLYLGETHYGL